MNSLEALKEIKNYTLVSYDEDGNQEDCIKFGELEPELIKTIEKDLKVLELLKKKEVDINCVKYTTTVESYNTYYIFERWKLTEEEYEIIKEWLRCKN